MNFLSPSQCRAARGLLDWSQPDLAEKCAMHVQTICAFEHETGTPTKTTLEKITKAFEDNGIEFTSYDGVRKTPSGLKIYRGNDGFRRFYDEQFKIFKKEGGDLWLYNGSSKLIIDALGQEHVEIQKKRMMKIKNRINYRIILEEGDNVMFGKDYAHYRWIHKDQFNDKTIFVYGAFTAFVDFNDGPTVTVIELREVADTMRQLMANSWDQAGKQQIS